MSAANGGVGPPLEGSVSAGSNDNTNGSKSNHQHKEAGRQVEMRNLTLRLVRERPFYPPLEGVSERSERGCGWFDFNLTESHVA